MKTTKEKKTHIIKEINTLLVKSISTTIIDYSKVTSLELKQMRKALFNKNIKAKVLKNNLTKKALIETENNKLLPYITGQILIVFSDTEISEPLKIIKKFNSKNENLKIKATYLYGKVFETTEIHKVVNLRSKEQELQKLIYSLKTPIIRLVQILNNLIKIKNGEKNENN
ncbi:MAG TPA: 50S ribosomal protein L10 [Candidatus Azoamicus sp.]